MKGQTLKLFAKFIKHIRKQRKYHQVKIHCYENWLNPKSSHAGVAGAVEARRARVAGRPGEQQAADAALPRRLRQPAVHGRHAHQVWRKHQRLGTGRSGSVLHT